MVAPMEPPSRKLPAVVQRQAERLVPGGPVGRAAAGALQKALTNPEVQRRVIEQSQRLVRKAQEWQAERGVEGASASARFDEALERVTNRFGQEGLSRRLGRVGESLAILVEARPPSPDAAAAFDELHAECDRLRAAIDVAGRLPLVKRKRAQFTIDRRLAELEDALLRHALA
jgi:hypothetical protein